MLRFAYLGRIVGIWRSNKDRIVLLWVLWWFYHKASLFYMNLAKQNLIIQCGAFWCLEILLNFKTRAWSEWLLLAHWKWLFLAHWRRFSPLNFFQTLICGWVYDSWGIALRSYILLFSFDFLGAFRLSDLILLFLKWWAFFHDYRLTLKMCLLKNFSFQIKVLLQFLSLAWIFECFFLLVNNWS